MQPDQARGRKEISLALVSAAAAVALGGYAYAAIRHARRARAAAGVEADRFRSAFESSPVGVILLSTEGRFLRANPAFCEMVEYTENELGGMTILDLTHRDDLTGTQAFMQELLAGKGRVSGLEKRYVTRSGAIVWVRKSASMSRDSQGAPLSYVAAVENVTERKVSEEARAALALELERANAILDTLFEKAPVGLGIWDRELRFVRINQTLADINGMPREAHTGKTIEELLPDLEPAVVQIFRRVIATGEAVVNREVSGATPADPGRVRHWNTSYFPLRIAGEIAGAGIVCEEITEKKLSDERLRQTAKLESLGVLAGGIAHDFNNLLTGILGNASLLAVEMHEHTSASSLVHGVVQAAERAADLTRQLLAYAGKGRFVVQPLNLSKVTREMAALVDLSRAGSVAVVLNLAPDLPMVEADSGQLQQIVMNLAINGSEAIGEGCPGTLTITTGVRDVEAGEAARYTPGEIAAGRYVSLEVRDTGCGMNAETLARIFDPFFTTKFMGRGLGLSAVLGIIGSHRGGLKVVSAPGQGTTFTVLLPVTEAQGADDEVLPAVKEIASGTVLVVDDERVVRQMAQAILQRYGYTAMVARDGAEGLAMLREHAEEIDLVLLDMTMPVMSGKDALREMQKIVPTVKVVLSSGYSEAEANRRFAGFNFTGFIQKPYTARQLKEKLETAMGAGTGGGITT